MAFLPVLLLLPYPLPSLQYWDNIDIETYCSIYVHDTHIDTAPSCIDTLFQHNITVIEYSG